MSDKMEYYRDVGGKYRWRRIAPNGEIVGASSESFSSKKNCVNNAERNRKPLR